MLDRVRALGLRSRLFLAISLVAVLALVGGFFVLRALNRSHLTGEIDRSLRADRDAYEVAVRGTHSAAALRARARQFIVNASRAPDSHILAITLPDGETLSNAPNLVSAAGSGTGDGDDVRSAVDLLRSGEGVNTVGAGDDQVRVLTAPFRASGGLASTFRAGQSLEQFEASQDSLTDTLLIVGLVVLTVLLASVLWIATLATRPIARIARFAREIDAGGLDRRLEEADGSAEVRALSSSFNRMLDRMQSAFDRERELVADASHELRTPITIVHGELELLRRELEPERRERLDVARRELVRMERLITEMLTLASADEAGAELARERVDVADMLSDLRRDLPLLGPRAYRVAEVGGTLECDPGRLAQVFRNLLTNAVAHTFEGGQIHVDVEPHGPNLVFRVGDDGPGVSGAEAERLFDRFYRAGPRGTRRSGSGLGLAIARAVVEAHGGTIHAGSSTLGGLEVSFELPGYVR